MTGSAVESVLNPHPSWRPRLSFIIVHTTLTPIAEEILFRGFGLWLLVAVLTFVRLPHRAAQVAAVLGCAVAFSALHTKADPTAIRIRTADGILYGILRYVSGSVAASALGHAGHNLGCLSVARVLAAPS
jgi:membrane protease YdiL (CAAX protease family)